MNKYLRITVERNYERLKTKSHSSVEMLLLWAAADGRAAPLLRPRQQDDLRQPQQLHPRLI